MKRGWGLLLAALILAVGLAACSGDKNEPVATPYDTQVNVLDKARELQRQSVNQAAQEAAKARHQAGETP